MEPLWHGDMAPPSMLQFMFTPLAAENANVATDDFEGCTGPEEMCTVGWLPFVTDRSQLAEFDSRPGSWALHLIPWQMLSIWYSCVATPSASNALYMGMVWVALGLIASWVAPMRKMGGSAGWSWE